jgi:hypothetical protein
LVNCLNIFCREVLNITINVLNDGGGVDGGKVNSDDSVIAAFQEDIFWASVVFDTILEAFFITTEKFRFFGNSLVEVFLQGLLSHHVILSSNINSAHEFVVHFSVRLFDGTNWGFVLVGKLLFLSFIHIHEVGFASSFSEASIDFLIFVFHSREIIVVKALSSGFLIAILSISWGKSFNHLNVEFKNWSPSFLHANVFFNFVMWVSINNGVSVHDLVFMMFFMKFFTSFLCEFTSIVKSFFVELDAFNNSDLVSWCDGKECSDSEFHI